MRRDGPGVVSSRHNDYFHRRMALIRATTDHTTAMRMLADLAAWNAVQMERRTYVDVHVSAANVR